jgi:hypothetical protein
MADPIVGTSRAVLGQGLGMGWGDEAEAWIRSKLGNESYEDSLKKIRSEYGQYSQEHPYVAGASEFAGGALPGLAMMAFPPTRQAGVQQVEKSAIPAWAKLAGAGGVTGAVSGAGAAEEGQRGSGAFTGGVMGTTLGH